MGASWSYHPYHPYGLHGGAYLENLNLRFRWRRPLQLESALPCYMGIVNIIGTSLGKIRHARIGGLILVVAFALSYLPPPALGMTSQDPPSYPDKVHVSNGCHLSTARFLAQFQSANPGEQGEILELCLPNADRTHAVALITWRGQLWCRDEYFGVFSLECRAEPKLEHKELAARAETLLRQQAYRLIHEEGAPKGYLARESMSADQRLAEVALAARIIPHPTTLFWIQCKNQEIPVLFFRLTSQRIAVYDPMHGTCLASCACRDDSKIVSYVAAKLGYSVDGVRSEQTIGSSTKGWIANPNSTLCR